MNVELSEFDKMNPAYKDAWTSALRSGKYQQVQGALRRSDTGMCCLGVLCDVVAPKDWRKDEGLATIIEDLESKVPALDGTDGCGTAWGFFTGEFYQDVEGNDVESQEDGELTESVRDEAGISFDVMYRLIKMNDEEKSSFSKIADFIEKNL
jgi:hypothetical protein